MHAFKVYERERERERERKKERKKEWLCAFLTSAV
jgi:hypothetical protein